MASGLNEVTKSPLSCLVENSLLFPSTRIDSTSLDTDPRRCSKVFDNTLSAGLNTYPHCIEALPLVVGFSHLLTTIGCQPLDFIEEEGEGKTTDIVFQGKIEKGAPLTSEEISELFSDLDRVANEVNSSWTSFQRLSSLAPPESKTPNPSECSEKELERHSSSSSMREGNPSSNEIPSIEPSCQAATLLCLEKEPEQPSSPSSIREGNPSSNEIEAINLTLPKTITAEALVPLRLASVKAKGHFIDITFDRSASSKNSGTTWNLFIPKPKTDDPPSDPSSLLARFVNPSIVIAARDSRERSSSKNRAFRITKDLVSCQIKSVAPSSVVQGLRP